MARIFCVAFVLLLSAAGTVVGEDNCSSSGSTVAVAPTDSVVELRLVYVTFPDYGQQTLPTWADTLKTEFNAFIQSMSHGKQRFNISTITDPANPGKAWIANLNYSNYTGQYGKLNRDMISSSTPAKGLSYASLIRSITSKLVARFRSHDGCDRTENQRHP